MPEAKTRKKPEASPLTAASREANKTAQALADHNDRVSSLKAKLDAELKKGEPLIKAARGAEARYMQLRQRAYAPSQPQPEPKYENPEPEGPDDDGLDPEE